MATSASSKCSMTVLILSKNITGLILLRQKMLETLPEDHPPEVPDGYVPIKLLTKVLGTPSRQSHAEVAPVRRSTTVRRQPGWLSD